MKLKQFNKRLGDGLWRGVPMDVYQQHPALSSTMLRVLLNSPLTYKRIMDRQLRRETTAAMEFGTAAHASILEGRMDAFHIQPSKCADGSDWNNRLKECSEWNKAHADKPVISADQAAGLSESRRYLLAHPKAGRLLTGGAPEVSAIAGTIKARCDYFKSDGAHATVVDLKTCVDASTPAFGREIVNRGYHIQAAWYRRVLKAIGFETVRFFFIALQKGQLPLVNVWELCTPAMDLADIEIARGLDLLMKCEVNQHWPEWGDYDGSNEIQTIDVPRWNYPEPELEGAEEV